MRWFSTYRRHTVGLRGPIEIIGRVRHEDRGPWPHPYPPVIARGVLVRILPGPAHKRIAAWLYLLFRGYGATAAGPADVRVKMGRLKKSPYSGDIFEAVEYWNRQCNARATEYKEQ